MHPIIEPHSPIFAASMSSVKLEDDSVNFNYLIFIRIFMYFHTKVGEMFVEVGASEFR